MNLLAQRIKETLDIRKVMEHYGVEFNRAGFAVCPFHDEKTASLSIKNGHYKCFGCGQYGDVINFVSVYFGISPSQAMMRLNDDFHLGICNEIPDQKTVSKIIAERKRKQKERADFESLYRQMENIHRVLWYAYIHYAPKSPDEPINDLYAQACRELDYYDWWFESHLWKEEQR